MAAVARRVLLHGQAAGGVRASRGGGAPPPTPLPRGPRGEGSVRGGHSLPPLWVQGRPAARQRVSVNRKERSSDH
eukprot:9470101-Pyramimonas_sp.AAC.1